MIDSWGSKPSHLINNYLANIMNRKRNVNYIKPEDPEFLKVLKKQVGYEEHNHKFDELQNAEGDFVDDADSEKPQVVVLKEGDLTVEEAEAEQKRLDKLESEKKANLNERVIFQAKPKGTEESRSRKREGEPKSKSKQKKKARQLLSFGDEEDELDSS